MLALTAAWLGLSAWLPSFGQTWTRALSKAIEDSGRSMLDDTLLTASIAGVKGPLVALSPLLGLIALASLLGWLVQGGLRFRSRTAAARVRTSSTAGLRTLWLCVKAIVLAAAVASVTHHGLRAMVSTPTADLGYTLRVLSAMTELLLSRVGVALFLLMVADVIVQRFLWRQSLRMTRDELKRELRETEGDPTLRAERRGRQRQTAMEP